MEFGLIALPLITLIVAGVSISYIFLAQASLDAAANEASRLILTGQAPASGQAGQFQSTACGYLPSYMSCSNLLVNVQTVSNYSDVSASAPAITLDAAGQATNALSYQPGSPGSIVVLQLLYMLPVLSGLDGFTPADLSNGKMLIVSTVVIKVEPNT